MEFASTPHNGHHHEKEAVDRRPVELRPCGTGGAPRPGLLLEKFLLQQVLHVYLRAAVQRLQSGVFRQHLLRRLLPVADVPAADVQLSPVPSHTELLPSGPDGPAVGGDLPGADPSARAPFPWPGFSALPVHDFPDAAPTGVRSHAAGWSGFHAAASDPSAHRDDSTWDEHPAHRLQLSTRGLPRLLAGLPHRLLDQCLCPAGLLAQWHALWSLVVPWSGKENVPGILPRNHPGPSFLSESLGKEARDSHHKKARPSPRGSGLIFLKCNWQ